MVTRTRRARSGSGFQSKDPFGLIWLALIGLGVIISKWWYFSPADVGGNNCVACVVALIGILWVVSLLLPSLFWIVWTKKNQKGIVFVFLLSLICLILAVIDYYAAQLVVNKLLYRGALRWEESQAPYLVDTFIPHTIGLLLISAMLYSVIRVFFCRDLVEKPLVYAFGAIVVVAVIPLFYVGLKLV